MNAKPAKRSAKATKLFVLDTNVLMHDPTSLYRFEEHDIFVPMMTLEELDANKKGMSEVARNARQASRLLDEIVSRLRARHQAGHRAGRGHRANSPPAACSCRPRRSTATCPRRCRPRAATTRSSAVLMHLCKAQPKRHVILVSKDINMRIKARALGLEAQDYFNDKVLEDTDLLYTGTLELPADFWDSHGQDMESWKQDGRTLYRSTARSAPTCWSTSSSISKPTRRSPSRPSCAKAPARAPCSTTLIDYSHQKNAVWGITARNREQNFALNLLMDPEIDFVTLLGQAGTGKTLLTLAAA